MPLAFCQGGGRNPYLDQKAEPSRASSQSEGLRMEREGLPEREREFLCRKARDTVRLFQERNRPRDPAANWTFGGK